ncbi:TonB-dependent receptor [Ningiella sp. W23]|uniref:TonB-dependent receptor n=1 Tax=Ningiella sp. W23 TaxID=3023715 RepID=UPI0037580284
MSTHKDFNRLKIAVAVAVALSTASTATMAQQTDEDENSEAPTEVIEVTGIRSALASALVEKRNSNNLVEVIQAEDIGKLPDLNLAEVLENITGVQIDRTAGVGTGVQIRGTGANRVEINGVSTIGSGNGRSGISFDDLPAALIASVEVSKVPTAATIEGSVGGTINLRTIRGLDLDEQLFTVRAQADRSDLAESTTPRLSATFGDNFEVGGGEMGVVATISYAELDVASFDPRFDRDREVLPDSGRLSAEAFPFLRTQFLDQQLTRFEYETTNFTGSIEYRPHDDLKVYTDVTINRQERIQQSARAFFSGTGANAAVDAMNNTAFETIDLGTIDGPNGDLVLGEVQVVTQGFVGVGVDSRNRIDPNLRVSSNNGSRITDSSVLAIGTEWQATDNFELITELSYSDNKSDFPNLSTTLDFINPNGPQPVPGASVDNGIPAEFDATNRTLQFGIAQGFDTSPSTADLLNPANYALRQANIGANKRKNTETAFRFDGKYDLTDVSEYFVDFRLGLRWNENTALVNNANSRSNFTNANTRFFRPTADLFSDVIVAGPDNFDAADGRRLFVRDYLMIDGALSFENPQAVLDSLNSAIAANNAAQIAAGNIADPYPLIGEATEDLSGFFDIREETLALYLQGDYDFEIGDVAIRGNLGLRYIETELTSVGNNIENGEITNQTTTQSDYNFILPRFNIVAEVTEDLIIRGGIAKDIRRPDFDDMSTSIAFGGNAGAAVNVGNPFLIPEKVLSYDLSLEYYISDSAFVSAGVFRKERTDVIDVIRDNPAEPISETGQIERDITPPCEGGGIFNPAVTDRNVWSSVEDGTGICVPLQTSINLPEEETQEGIELAAQYDLSEFESELGWASGFGVIVNYTYQEAGFQFEDFRPATGDANALNKLLGRTDTDQSTPTLDDDVVEERFQLTNLSNDSYNFTLFYDKYDISVRARYTWRSAFRTSSLISFDMPRIVDDRAQLNMNASYDINEMFTVSIDGVNLLREDRTEWCVNENALLCAQGLTDRRVILGVTGRF